MANSLLRVQKFSPELKNNHKFKSFKKRTQITFNIKSNYVHFSYISLKILHRETLKIR